MGALKDQISKEIIAAMKAKDKIRLNALRYVKKLFIENDTAVKKQEELDIIISYAKKVKDSYDIYPENSQQRIDILAEVKVLEEFLPQQINEDEVKALIIEIKSKQDTPNMGSIMKELSPQIRGKFDGKLASKLVIETLKG